MPVLSQYFARKCFANSNSLHPSPGWTDSRIHFLSSSNAANISTAAYHDISSFWVGAIAVSGDVAVAGDPYGGDHASGVVHVLERDSDTWNQTMIISPTNLDERSVYGQSISIDGNVMVVSGPDDRGTLGTAYIYNKQENGTWAEDAKLVPDDKRTQNFGHATSVHDGVVAIGDNLYGDDGEGAVFVYSHNFDPVVNSSQWTLNTTITNEDCDGSFGNSIALTDDTDLVIGCPKDDGDAGSVYYYKQKGEGQYVLHQKIIPRREANDSDTADEFGGELALDGNFMVASTYEQVNGKVHVFTLHDNLWKEVTAIQSPNVNYTYFGYDIEISGDNVFVSHWENIYSYRLECSDNE